MAYASMASGAGGTPAIHYLDLDSLFAAVPSALASSRKSVPARVSLSKGR